MVVGHFEMIGLALAAECVHCELLNMSKRFVLFCFFFALKTSSDF